MTKGTKHFLGWCTTYKIVKPVLRGHLWKKEKVAL